MEKKPDEFEFTSFITTMVELYLQRKQNVINTMMRDRVLSELDSMLLDSKTRCEFIDKLRDSFHHIFVGMIDSIAQKEEG